MNLLMSRAEGQGMPRVYAFNTFFYPKVMSGGQASVKRWTRKVDIFSYDYILIPVHLGMHWCLAVSMVVRLFCLTFLMTIVIVHRPNIEVDCHPDMSAYIEQFVIL